MKTLTEKYRAIQENRYTKAQFVRDARLEHPQLITQYNGYDDTVSILKNKGMISEAVAKFVQMHVRDMEGKDVGKYYFPTSFQEDQKHASEIVDYFHSWIKNKTPMGERAPYVIWQHEGVIEPDKDAVELTAKDLEDAKKIKAIVLRRARQISASGYERSKMSRYDWYKGIDPNKDLKEEYQYQGEPNYSLDALERGIDVELEKMGLNSALAPKEEELEKAKKTATKNLEKNPNHYVELVAGDHAPKGDEDEMVPATKSNTVDKKNGMVKAKLKEAVKTLIVNALNESTEEEIIVESVGSMEEFEGRTKDFEGLQKVLDQLKEVVDEVVEYKKSIDAKLTEIFKTVGEEVKNKEGIKVGAFIAPGLEEAFRVSLMKKIGPHRYGPHNIPKVKILRKDQMDEGVKKRFNLEGKIF